MGAVLAGGCHGALYLQAPAIPAAVWDYAAPAVLLQEAAAWFGTGDGEEFLAMRPKQLHGQLDDQLRQDFEYSDWRLCAAPRSPGRWLQQGPSKRFRTKSRSSSSR